MVKGISRQVIVVKGAEQALFEQAIFILKDRAVGKRGVTDAQLLREADRLMAGQKKQERPLPCLVWGFVGSCVTAVIFLLCGLL